MSCNYPVRSLYIYPQGDYPGKLLYGKASGRPLGVTDGGRAEVMDVPCGQCAGCRLEYSRVWAMRCQLESQLYPPFHCWMLTLTYDDDHLPEGDRVLADSETGEVLVDVHTYPLVQSAVSQFVRRVRRHWRESLGHTGIRFFACGEYGELSQRPHYHVVLFNLPFPSGDLELLKQVDGMNYWTSKSISKLWRFGNHIITDCTFDSVAYVARYMLKKHKGKDRDWYADHGLTPEFSCASNHPGIAAEWYEQHKDIYLRGIDSVCFQGRSGATTAKPPRSFDRLFELEDPDLLREIKQRRQAVGRARRDLELSKKHLTDTVESVYNSLGQERERQLVARSHRTRDPT